MVKHVVTLVMFLSATLFIAGCDDAATRPTNRPEPANKGDSGMDPEDAKEQKEREDPEGDFERNKVP